MANPPCHRKPRLLGKVRGGLLCLSVASWMLAIEAPTGAQAVDLDVLLDRLAAYLDDYESSLGSLVADERFVQERRYRGRPLEVRVTNAEVLFLRLPGEAEWYGVRDVKKVNGRAVPGIGVSLADLLKDPGKDFVQKAAAIVEASSRHNLGFHRTINMPTVPLEMLSGRNHSRFFFTPRGRSKVDGVSTERLEFTEFDEPTIVRSPDGQPLWSRGSAWVDPATGALWRAELAVSPVPPNRTRQPALEARLRVEFTRDKALDLIVPRMMAENFWVQYGAGYGEGKYSNYRRYTTTARLIP